MKLMRTMTLLLAVCLPATWTLAHAEDAPPAADAPAKPKKKGKKKMKKDAAPPADATK